ncbi:hypothetical protein GQ457_01G030310 [Hibiscus cannabinus]
MDLSLICDSLTIFTCQGLGFAKSIIDRHRYLAKNSCLSISSYSSAHNLLILHVTAGIVPIDAVAPPPVKPNSYRTLPRTLLRRKRRTKRKLFSGDDSKDSEDYGLLFGGDGGDGYGNFGNGNGGGSSWGGSGWNFGGFEGQNWDGSSSPWTGTALGFVYEVITWIALSNCLHFAFKKMVRIVTNLTDEAADREKVPI